MLKPRNTRNMRKKAGLLGTTRAPAPSMEEGRGKKPRRLPTSDLRPPNPLSPLPSPLFPLPSPILALVLRQIVTVS